MRATTPVEAAPSRRRATKAAIAWFAALMIVAFGPTLHRLARTWFDPSTDMQHGAIVPLLAAYMVWNIRSALQACPARTSGWGLAVLIAASLLACLAQIPDWIFVGNVAFLAALIGCIWSMRGVATVRCLAYPLFILVLMIPPPSFLYELLTLRLQLVASRMGELGLEALGYSVLREGNILELAGERLSVAEACSGLRSLTTVIFFCLVYNYVFVKQASVRWTILAAVIPITLMGNAVRIVLAGVVGEYDPVLAHGALHEFTGYVSAAAALAACGVIHKLLVRGTRGGSHPA